MDYPYQYAVIRFDGSKTASGGADVGFKTDGSVPFTVDAFIRMTEKLTEKEILSQPGSFSLGISGNKPYFRMEGFPEIIATEEVPVLVGDWAHVCVVYGRPATVLYVNGIEAASADLTGTGSESSEPFVFFRNTVGELRQVRFFDSALTAENVMHYMMETDVDALTSLTAYFDFSRIPAEEIIRELPVEVEDATMYQLYSQGALFLGHTFASIDKEPRINPGGKHNDSYTVQAWVYFRECEEGEKQTIFSNGDVTADAGMSLYIEKISGEYKVKGLRGTTGADSILMSSASVQPKQWVNLALTYDIDTMELYIDGVFDVRLDRLFPIEVELEDPCLYIGAEVVDNGLNGRDWLKGCISQLDIWERRLDADEIAGYARSAPPTDAMGLQASYAFHIAGNNNSCTEVLLGEHNRFSYGEISYPFAGQGTQRFREISSALPDEDIEPLSAEMLAEFRREAYEKRREGLADGLLTELAEKQGIQVDPDRFLFTVTMHRLDGKVYFVAHTADKSYTVYSDDEDFEKEENLWYAQLLLIILLGILEIFLGLSVKASSALLSRLSKLASNATIRLMFTGTITFTTLTGFLVYLHKQNQLKEIAKEAFMGLKWWTVALMVAKLVALAISWIYGATAVYFAVAIGVLIAEVVIHISQKPKRTIEIALASVMFNHADAPYVLDDFKLDKDTDAPVPEWTSSKTNRSNTVFIMDQISGDIVVKASFETNQALTVYVRCIDESESKILGNSSEVKVIADKAGRTAYFNFVFKKHKLASSGVRYDEIKLSWRGGDVAAGEAAGATAVVEGEEIKKTTHYSYAIMTKPYLPWREGLKPTKAVLDKAIDLINVNNPNVKIVNWHQAARVITAKVNGRLGLYYNTHRGAALFVFSDMDDFCFFNLKGFMNYLNDDKTANHPVNCTDCAAIVSTFANALGCHLSQKIMTGYEEESEEESENKYTGFRLNEIIKIGDTTWDTPFNGSFGYHEVCMMEPLENYWNTFPPQNDYMIYDACLRVNATRTPGLGEDEEKLAALPTGMRFSRFNDNEDLNDIADRIPENDSYREHLAELSNEGVKNCIYNDEFNVVPNIYKAVIL